MKLAVLTDEVTQELETAVKFARRFDLDGVELRTIWDRPLHDLSDQELARLRGVLEAHGLSVPGVASPVFKCELDDREAHQVHLGYLRKWIRAAKLLHAGAIRVFTFWKRGPSAEVWDRIKAQFRPALSLAEGEGITLGLENEASTYCATAAETRRFVTEMNSPNLKVVWDPCNEVFAEEGVTPYPDAYRLIQPWAIHVHVKDARGQAPRGEPALTPVGEGDIDWMGQLRELLASGYTGYLSLETHWRPAALPEEVINLPGGSRFSDAGEYASDLCMHNLLRILAEARRKSG